MYNRKKFRGLSSLPLKSVLFEIINIVKTAYLSHNKIINK